MSSFFRKVLLVGALIMLVLMLIVEFRGLFVSDYIFTSESFTESAESLFNQEKKVQPNTIKEISFNTWNYCDDCELDNGELTVYDSKGVQKKFTFSGTWLSNDSIVIVLDDKGKDWNKGGKEISGWIEYKLLRLIELTLKDQVLTGGRF